MLRHVTFVLLLLVIAFPRDVHAYLDPGTGSLIFQTVVAALAAAAYGFRAYLGRIRTLFRRDSAETRDEDRPRG